MTGFTACTSPKPVTDRRSTLSPIQLACEICGLKVERFVSAIIELPLDRAGAEAAANIRAELERQGTPIGPDDLLMAGQAKVGGLTLVTNNVREFQRVSGLKLESWP